MVVVKFYQPRCRSCLAVGRKLDVLARRRPTHRIFEVDVTTAGGNRIATLAGFPEGLPSLSVYRKQELVWSKVLPPRLFEELTDVLDEQESGASGASGGGAAEAGLDFAWDMLSNLRRSAQER